MTSAFLSSSKCICDFKHWHSSGWGREPHAYNLSCVLFLVTLYIVPLQVPETLPEGVLEKMHAPPKPDVPIVDVHEISSADGFVFAFPTR